MRDRRRYHLPRREALQRTHLMGPGVRARATRASGCIEVARRGSRDRKKVGGPKSALESPDRARRNGGCTITAPQAAARDTGYSEVGSLIRHWDLEAEGMELLGGCYSYK